MINSADRAAKIKKVSRLFKSGSFGLWGTLSLVLLLLIFKGTSGEGQTTLFSNLIRKYVEETAASMASRTQSPIQLQLADISSLIALNASDLGQGGQENTIAPSPINENSFMAHSPTNTNYIEETGFKRNQVAEYTVQQGDRLSFIASDFGVSINSVIWANKLKDANSISPGQILKIPPVSGVIHEVKKGDTLTIIAKKYGAEESKITEFNSLPQDGQLQIGDEIIVPDGEVKGPIYAIKPVGTSTTASLRTAKRFSYLPDLGDYFMPPAQGYNWGRIHSRNGVDIANSCGTPIYAANEGSITTADGSGWNGGFGKFIKVLHPNGTETVYGHASKLLVSVGEYVSRGQMVALMGSTGRSTGCHLHFEVHGARNPLIKY